MNKFILSSFTSVVVAGTLFSGLPINQTSTSSLSRVHNEIAKATSHSTLDLSLVNDEKLLDSLVKRGVIPANATKSEKQAALASYLELKGKPDTVKEKDPLAAKVKKAESTKHSEFKEFNNGLLHGNGKKNGHLKGTPDPVQESQSPGIAKKGKLLTLMVEYSDFAHNNLTKNDTDNYYTDYNTAHYEDMIFGKNGVKGPNGETFLSQKQYYEQQSGGTYTVDGKAYGWLKVPGTAKFYGLDSKTGHDNVTPGGAKQLIVDTYKAALAAGIPLGDYDLEDPHDLDGDGNFWESDGLVDHLQIIHSGMGQEAGGGSLGDDAIWSHRSAKFVDLDGLGAGKPGFYDYTIMPEDGATGVFAHEYGHDLGLPDEYDTIYSGAGEAVEYWSIMSAGSWAGTIPGTEPTGFSPWAKSYFQSTLGGKWTNPTVVNWEDVSTKGTQFLLDQANSPNGQNNQAIQVDFTEKKTPVNTPATGSYEYWGGQADEMDNSIVTNVDLTGKNSATLTFDAWYDMEEQWDFAFVQVSSDNGATWKSLGNGHTRSDVVSEGYPTILDSMPGFTGKSNGWEPQTFNLSDYKGQKIQLRLRSATDWGTSNAGFFADNIKVVADGTTLVDDGAENSTSPFTLNGFKKFDGNKYSNHYYLLEWRNHQGADQGLAHIKRGNSLMSYDGGLVVWYVDDSFTENWSGIHPGDGFLGVVDAHDDTDLMWNIGAEASSRYHVADAAFGLNSTSGYNLNYPDMSLISPSQAGISLFDDKKDYNNSFLPDAGRNIGHFGLKVRVNGQSTDKSVGSIVVYK